VYKKNIIENGGGGGHGPHCPSTSATDYSGHKCYFLFFIKQKCAIFFVFWFFTFVCVSSTFPNQKLQDDKIAVFWTSIHMFSGIFSSTFSISS